MSRQKCSVREAGRHAVIEHLTLLVHLGERGWASIRSYHSLGKYVVRVLELEVLIICLCLANFRAMIDNSGVCQCTRAVASRDYCLI